MRQFVQEKKGRVGICIGCPEAASPCDLVQRPEEAEGGACVDRHLGGRVLQAGVQQVPRPEHKSMCGV